MPGETNGNDNPREYPGESEEQIQIDLQSEGFKRQKSRYRASVACASCRDRRIRCVVPPGKTVCTQCKKSGAECIIKNDDERRRPISRAYMCSLTDRVALLENLLREHNIEPPPAQYPPMSRHMKNEGISPSRQIPGNYIPGSSHAQQEFTHISMEQFKQNHGQQIGSEWQLTGDADRASSYRGVSLNKSKGEGMIHRLLGTSGHLSFDQLNERLRYYGPTTIPHVHSGFGSSLEDSAGSAEQARRAEQVIERLPVDTHDYLIGLFWKYYNNVVHVIHQDAFLEDRNSGRTQFYSGFLHICILAMGFRFADKTRPDIQRITLPRKESTLHREAKYILDSELERPGGIPTVIALLLVSDLECGVGRENVGWLYTGMAIRQAFDIGLHLDIRSSALSEREVETRRLAFWSCVIYDKHWALFLGRPPSMKPSDLEINNLSRHFERLGTYRPAGPGKSWETQIYEAILDLLELAGKITEHIDSESPIDAEIARNSYRRIAALDREFNRWYERLPEILKWTQANIDSAPFSFFVLHQQYHALLICLHRPYAMYAGPNPNENENGTGNHVRNSGFEGPCSSLSRDICTKHAIRIAKIFSTHRQRFDIKQIFVTGMQNAVSAATALVVDLAFIKDSSDRQAKMQYLDILYGALQEMTVTFQPAQRMSLVLRTVMEELRGGESPFNGSFAKPSLSLVPTRRGSIPHNDSQGDGAVKRSRTNGGFNQRHSSNTAAPWSAPLNWQTDPTLANITPLTQGSSHLHRFHPSLLPSDVGRDQPKGFVVTPRSNATSWIHPTMAIEGIPVHRNVADPNPIPLNNIVSGPFGSFGMESRGVDIAGLASGNFPEITPVDQGVDCEMIGENKMYPTESDLAWASADIENGSVDLAKFARKYFLEITPVDQEVDHEMTGEGTQIQAASSNPAWTSANIETNRVNLAKFASKQFPEFDSLLQEAHPVETGDGEADGVGELEPTGREGDAEMGEPVDFRTLGTLGTLRGEEWKEWHRVGMGGGGGLIW
ncbi:hypothetical protein P152DRAFT_490398 [Eremomyces bilateralis CBS 781.70]|uniref:Zn(2)-C6 fungal-type domain-containing protein n=1 Tax=Eremomyces bilateralis CBS 781.70 TaxID=1392243 RepID=A0A6G1FYG9_9PEZI|nr:uncharacterized protein P152DRAFT_490398 [Eremomyces bilateralis CBS 781.70]KAF1810741.1 hypothetical protein P152DRAFT_490398 [Eremomyces bilateralis CBS 781.70]